MSSRKLVTSLGRFFENGRNKQILTLCSQTRNKSYYDSNVPEDPSVYTGVEKSYEEWKFVERLIPPKIVATPPSDPNMELPSGWRAQKMVSDCSYFIHRTKNHMIPVYLIINDVKGMIRNTRIKKVEGNLWELEKEVGKFLKEKYPRKMIRTHVQECAGYVNIRGEYVDEVKEWVASKGF